MKKKRRKFSGAFKAKVALRRSRSGRLLQNYLNDLKYVPT